MVVRAQLLHLVGVDPSPRISGHLANGLKQHLPGTQLTWGFSIVVDYHVTGLPSE